jgi:RNA polymerase sigma factor (sigma-70 family)
MDDGQSNSSDVALKQGGFVPTRWSLVLEAGRDGSPQAEAAMSKLCQTYWYPLYFYARRSGQSTHDAEDLTQAFFARLLEKSFLESADREKGRFRSFLLTVFKRFLANEWTRANREKRGGGHQILSLNEENTEIRYRSEPADEMTPEKAFEQRWALAVIEQALRRLEDEFVESGRPEQFAALKQYLTGDDSTGTYEDTAARLQMTEGTLRVRIHRLRQRYRELLRMEIAETVASHADVDEELRFLFSALRG